MSKIDHYMYKKSGLDWIDTVPEHWSVTPNRTLFIESNIKNQADQQLLSITIAKGIITQSELLHNSSKKDSSNIDKSKYKLVELNDIAYNKMRAWQGAIGVSSHKGIVSPAYIVHKPRINLCMKYYHYLFRTPNMIKEFQKWSYGITSDQWSLRPEHFRLIETILPPYEEQKQIVRFLDHKNSLISKFIHIKRKQIELLKELKQAIINDAVTGKIDVSTGKPYPKHKDSGVEWLVDIPDGWAVKRLKDFSKIVLGKMLKTVKSEGEELKPYMRSANIQWITPSVSDVNSMWFSRKEMSIYRLAKHDILVSEGGDVGRACIWNEELPECYIQNSVFKITTNNQVIPAYLLYAFTEKASRGFFKTYVNRVSIGHLTKEKIVSIPFILPPIEEQQKILEYIANIGNSIDLSIASSQSQLAKIEELQTRLITDVVTGKLNVQDQNVFNKSKKSNIYFKRAVLSAEIIEQLYNEPTLGHVKFQKVLYISERLCELNIGTNYHRAAAGPYDGKAIRSIDKQLSELRWYEAKGIDGRFKYVPLAKAGQHKKYFASHFGHIEKELNRIINNLRKLDTERCEMIATLFSAWEDLLGNNVPVNDDNIIFEVTENWTESKKRIPVKRWSKCLMWMRENHMTPLDIGRFNAD